MCDIRAANADFLTAIFDVDPEKAVVDDKTSESPLDINPVFFDGFSDKLPTFR
ncbi:MAG: hypothetical protein WAW00_03685 [Candidatus Moraniibacteriota bacterium]